jgi:hypothetical protein
MIKINKSQIVKIELNESVKNNSIRFQQKKSFLGFEVEPEGWYIEFDNFCIDIPDISKYLIIDGDVFDKPNIVLYLSNRTKETISFYTDKEMIDFFIQNLSDLNLININ